MTPSVCDMNPWNGICRLDVDFEGVGAGAKKEVGLTLYAKPEMVLAAFYPGIPEALDGPFGRLPAVKALGTEVCCHWLIDAALAEWTGAYEAGDFCFDVGSVGSPAAFWAGQNSAGGSLTVSKATQAKSPNADWDEAGRVEMAHAVLDGLTGLLRGGAIGWVRSERPSDWPTDVMERLGAATERALLSMSAKKSRLKAPWGPVSV